MSETPDIPTRPFDWYLYNRAMPVIKDHDVSPRVKAWVKRMKKIPEAQQDGIAGNVVNLVNLPMHTELLIVTLQAAVIDLEQGYEGLAITWKDHETPVLVIGRE